MLMNPFNITTDNNTIFTDIEMSSNPFDIVQDENIISSTENIIEIWLESKGRKKNTLITGWILPENELEKHFKIMKDKKGCGGSIKLKPSDTDDKLSIVVQLQGDHIEYVTKYLIESGQNATNIRIKG